MFQNFIYDVFQFNDFMDFFHWILYNVSILLIELSCFKPLKICFIIILNNLYNLQNAQTWI